MRMEFGAKVFAATRAVLENLHKIGVVHVMCGLQTSSKEQKPADTVAGAGAEVPASDLQIILSDFGEAENSPAARSALLCTAITGSGLLSLWIRAEK